MSTSLAFPPRRVDSEQSDISESVPVPLMRVCSGCGLTEEELNHTGILGCARCYVTFAALIAKAVEELHGLRVPASYVEPSTPPRTITNPWPTRRSVRL